MMNNRLIWLLFLFGVGNIYFVDGYKCEFQQEKNRPNDYICIIIPDSSENSEKHISGKTDDDVIALRFEANLHNISHFSQSESTPFCQRFKNMTKITIKDDKLTSIDENSFRGCKDIKKIEIKFTNIQEFPENLFSDNSKLTELWVYAIELTTLPENIFASQTELSVLSLGAIAFAFLPPNIFKPLTKLERLDFMGINLKINPKWFESLKSLKRLDLNTNRITDLPKDVFSSLENLLSVDLSINQLKVIHSDAFGTLDKLEAIDLSYNKVYAIDEKFINNTGLYWLDIRGNKCAKERIAKREDLKGKLAQCFNDYQPRSEQENYNCKYIETGNHGYTCEVKPFVKKADKDVKIVKFDGNTDSISNLTKSMFPVCERFQNLEEIEIKWVKSVDEDFLDFCDNLKVLDIQNTEIEEISEDSIRTNPLLTKLIIQGSKFTTLPKNFFVSQHELLELHLHQNQITSLPDEIFNSLKKLRELSLQGNKIQILNPKWFQKLSNLAELDLRRNEIAKLPEHMFSPLKNLQKLLLSFNQLTAINSESFGTLQKLTNLDLFENKIDAIDEKLIDNTGVRMIDMEGNVCSQDDILDRDDIKDSLRKCFENFNTKLNFECGKPKIMNNGTESRHGEFPWNAALFTSGQFFCGGTLISSRLVVTVMFCTMRQKSISDLNPKNLSVVLGAHNLSDTNEPGRVNVGVKAIHTEPSLDYDADIAIWELNDNVQFSDYIQPICIAQPETEPALESSGYVAGFGGDESSVISDVARFIPTPIFNFDNCTQISAMTSYVNEGTICGGYANGTGVCDGDSGSGVIVVHGGIHYLRGIVSTPLFDENDNCDKNQHSIFTNIVSSYNWIKTKQNDEV